MKIKKILGLSILSLFFIISPVINQAAAEKPNFYIDISLFPEGYAKFKVDADNYGNLGDVVLELPTLKCEEINTSDLRKKIRVTDIPDMQTYEGHIDLRPDCSGVGIMRPHGNLKNSTISFTYQNFDWQWHPEKYPFDGYNMSLLISFPVIRTEDSISASIRILLPPSMVVTNRSAYLIWEHPANTSYKFIPFDSSLDMQGNQQIILLETRTFFKDNPAPAIYIPLEFERKDSFLQIGFEMIIVFLMIILILLSALIYKKENTDLGILTIVALLFSSYQLLAHDKPVGVTTILDRLFLFFIGWSLFLFIFHTDNKLGILRVKIIRLWNKSKSATWHLLQIVNK